MVRLMTCLAAAVAFAGPAAAAQGPTPTLGEARSAVFRVYGVAAKAQTDHGSGIRIVDRCPVVKSRHARDCHVRIVGNAPANLRVRVSIEDSFYVIAAWTWKA